MSVIKVFLSSTSKDLDGHRAKVSEAIRSMGLAAEQMELFQAQPGDTVSACLRLVQDSDALVLIIAHRYGWVPKATEHAKADGQRSITWLEYEQATSEGKPVFVFMVDDGASWTGGREQDRLVDPNEDPAVVATSVRELGKFKALLKNSTILSFFTTPDDLAWRVTASLGRWGFERLGRIGGPATTAPVTTPSTKETDALSELVAAFELAEDGQLPSAWQRAQKSLEVLASLREAGQLANRREATDQALRALSLCRRGFNENADETMASALLLGRISAETSVDSWIAQATALSLRARSSWDLGEPDKAFEQAAESLDLLNRALDIYPEDIEAGSVRGGLLKRRADWWPAEDPRRTRDTLQAAESYRIAAQTNDPYPVFNWVVERAVAEPKLPLVRSSDDRELLLRAMSTRYGQQENGLQRPWASFDLALGRHFLNPDVGRLLNDLQTGIAEAARKAKSPSQDGWMVKTALTTWKRLCESGANVQGAELAVALFETSLVGDQWFHNRDQQPLGGIATLLKDEFSSIRQELERLQKSAKAGETTLEELLIRSEARWEREDEERFQVWLEEARKSWEPRQRKWLRVLWKVFGGKTAEALGEAVDSEALGSIVAEGIDALNDGEL